MEALQKKCIPWIWWNFFTISYVFFHSRSVSRSQLWAYHPDSVIKTGSQSGKVLPGFLCGAPHLPGSSGSFAFPGSDFPEDLIHWRYLAEGFQSCSKDTWFLKNISFFSCFEKIQNLIVGVFVGMYLHWRVKKSMGITPVLHHSKKKSGFCCNFCCRAVWKIDHWKPWLLMDMGNNLIPKGEECIFVCFFILMEVARRGL